VTQLLTAALYGSQDRDLWDGFVRQSRNGTFLFERDYMEYHADRFADFSLVVRADGAPLALMPANRCGEVVESHGGLTYGGFVLPHHLTTLRMTEVLAEVVRFLRHQGVRLLRYKAIPYIYREAAGEEDLFALSAAGGRLARRAALAVIDLGLPRRRQERRRRALRKAERAGLVAAEWDGAPGPADLAAYWNLLEAVLDERYRARPVHSLAEIQRLHQRFPRQIRLFTASRQGRPVAGVLVYETRTVVRAQYIAAAAEGREFGALDLLFEHLLAEAFSAKRFMDLGTSEGEGRAGLNEGVIEFKEGLGARTVALDTYELSIAGGTDALTREEEGR
jgi:hypothetical protein